MVPDMFVYAKDEKHETELKVIFRLDSNFLKHAAKDPNEVHHLATRVYPLVLLDAINTYVRLGFPARPLFTAFMLWMGLNYPQFLAEPLSESFRQLRSIQQAGAFSKKDLLDAALKLVTQQTAAGV